jgi:hypothetical protein
MATRQGAVHKRDDNFTVATWAPLTKLNDVGSPVQMGSECEGWSIQLSGTLGSGGEVTLEGSNDGIVYGTLHALDGSALVLDALGFHGGFAERPLLIRPKLTGAEGGVTSISVTIVGARRR